MRAVGTVIALILAGCAPSPATPTGGGATAQSSTAAVASSGVTTAPGSPGGTLDPARVPPGRIAYMRVDQDEVERYFVVDSTGSNEQALFETQGCACIRWSADGTQIWTVTETETGLRYTTMNPDGSNRVVHTPEIETLNLAPGFGSADGRHVGFFGWDDSDPSRTGVWAARTDLSRLHQVTGVPKGVLMIDPIGMSPDGSHIYFHGDLGENTDNPFHHAGNVYVIGSDGNGLRQLNPVGTKTEITGAGLARDGRLAFTAWPAGNKSQANALFVVDDQAAEAEQVTDWTVGLWGAAWAPSGEWIAVTQSGGPAAVASLIRPDGTDLHALAPADRSEPIFGPTWSPEGTHFLVRRGGQHANDLWIMDLEGNLVWQVTHALSSHDIYSWAGPAPQ